MPIEDVTLGEVYRGLLALGQTVQRLEDAVTDLRSNLTREVQELVQAQGASQAKTLADHETRLKDHETRMQALENSQVPNTLTQKIVFGAVGLILVAVLGALVALVVTNGSSHHS